VAADRSAPPALAALKPVAQRRAFEAILDQLEALIAAGVLRAGDRLPTERDLAAQLRVSRTSVREALRVLEALGLVETRRGSDNGAVLLREPGNAFATSVRLLAALGHVELEEIVDFRAIVESGAARQLAEQPDADVLAALEALVERAEADDVERDEFHALDAEFHITLVRAAGNRLVNLMESGVDSALRRVIAEVGFLEARWSDIRPRILSEHRALLDAIRRGDGGQAADLANGHVRYWGGRVIAHARDS
jgi:GntR family transcriptional repressor for pyruvate dehydrogenase complex